MKLQEKSRNPQAANSDWLMDLKEVSGIVNLQKSAIHARIEAGTFPAGTLLSSRCRRWKASEIYAWVAAL